MNVRAWIESHRREALIAAGAFAVVVALVLRKRAAGAAAAATNAQLTQPVPPYDPTTDPNAIAANGGFDPASLTSGYPSSLGGGGGFGVTAGPPDLTPSLDALTNAVDALPSAIASAITPVDTGSGSAPGGTTGSGGGGGSNNTTPTPAPKTAAGFWWGDKFITSANDLAAYEASHGNSGFDLATWAAQHADAARSIGLTPPPPPPKQTPAPSSAVSVESAPRTSSIAESHVAPAALAAAVAAAAVRAPAPGTIAAKGTVKKPAVNVSGYNRKTVANLH